MDKNSFLIKLSEGAHTDFGKVEFDKQPENQKVFSAIWGLEGQVNNGGFLQYFESCHGATANFAPSALRRIGAGKCASIVERALGAVSNRPLPHDPDGRAALIQSLDATSQAEVDALDAEFFSYPDNLTDLLFDFVRAHPESFGSIAEF